MPSTHHEFTAIIEEGENGWWVATSPEVPAAVGQGRNVDAARDDLEAAILLVLAYQREQGESKASPSAIRQVLTVG
jgi:predicted RNase H-like HicB family nuclease